MEIEPQDFGKVAVLMGGTHSEREISMLSGENVLSAMKRCDVDAYGIDVSADIIEQLQNNRPNRAFIALHGIGGEDGTIQGVLEILQIPYPGSGVAASALTLNKFHCNGFLSSMDVPVLPFALLNNADDTATISTNNFNFPLCIKPVSGGSSCGVTKITNIEQLTKAYNLARQHDTKVIVEKWVEGREFTVSILGEQALPVIEITTPSGEFYDYEAKYYKQTTGYICPCDLSQSQQRELQVLALNAFKLTGCKHWGRVDFMQDDKGKFWLLDINTIPGLTSHSLLPMAAKQTGVDFDELIWKILIFSL